VETVSFVGVTTSQSASMRMFPAWAEELGLGDVQLVGKDLPIHAERHRYREAVQEIKGDEHNRGALITTHKIDLFEACRDLFDRIDESARLTGETSCLSKRDGLLCARATDPVAAGKALRDSGELHSPARGGMPERFPAKCEAVRRRKRVPYQESRT